MEQWKVIESHKDYAISSLGRVKRLTSRTCAKAGSILKTPIRSKASPYPCVDLCADGTRRTVAVHQLVAEAFLPAPDFMGAEVNHIDGNKANPIASNLEWVTSSGNKKHAYREGLSKAHGEHNGKAKLTDRAVVEIRSSLESDEDLANRFGVTAWTIRDARHMKTWQHV